MAFERSTLNCPVKSVATDRRGEPPELAAAGRLGGRWIMSSSAAAAAAASGNHSFWSAHMPTAARARVPRDQPSLVRVCDASECSRIGR